MRALLIAALCGLLLASGGSAAHAVTPPSASAVQRNVQPSRRRIGAARAKGVRVADVPPPWEGAARQESRVADRAGLLDRAARARLDELIRSTEARTGSEVRVVTLRTLGGRDQARFATTLFNAWEIGADAAGQRGVLVLFVRDGGARRAGRVQVAVSRSLNGRVSHRWTERMLAASVLPLLREAEYARGFTRCIERLAPRLSRDGAAVLADDVLGGGVPGAAALAAGGVGVVAHAWWADRRSRECEQCGALCARAGCGAWTQAVPPTDLSAGRRERALTCHSCGAVSTKTQPIPKFDGRRRRAGGGWDYFYYSGDGDGGGSDGGGGGGGDC